MLITPEMESRNNGNSCMTIYSLFVSINYR